MLVRPVKLPSESALHEVIQPGDFVDCYYNDTVPGGVSVSEATMMALAQMPKWVGALMKIRNCAVSFYGLKTGADVPALFRGDKDLAVGDQIGVFRVRSVTKDEILMGEDDKHLNFLISVLRHEQGFTVATWVRTHNRFGRVYLWTIMPFHKLIVRDAVKRISRAAGDVLP